MNIPKLSSAPFENNIVFEDPQFFVAEFLPPLKVGYYAIHSFLLAAECASPRSSSVHNDILTSGSFGKLNEFFCARNDILFYGLAQLVVGDGTTINGNLRSFCDRMCSRRKISSKRALYRNNTSCCTVTASAATREANITHHPRGRHQVQYRLERCEKNIRDGLFQFACLAGVLAASVPKPVLLQRGDTCPPTDFL